MGASTEMHILGQLKKGQGETNKKFDDLGNKFDSIGALTDFSSKKLTELVTEQRKTNELLTSLIGALNSQGTG